MAGAVVAVVVKTVVSLGVSKLISKVTGNEFLGMAAGVLAGGAIGGKLIGAGADVSAGISAGATDPIMQTAANAAQPFGGSALAGAGFDAGSKGLLNSFTAATTNASNLASGAGDILAGSSADIASGSSTGVTSLVGGESALANAGKTASEFLDKGASWVKSNPELTKGLLGGVKGAISMKQEKDRLEQEGEDREEYYRRHDVDNNLDIGSLDDVVNRPLAEGGYVSQGARLQRGRRTPSYQNQRSQNLQSLMDNTKEGVK